jgi:hypothetical protein
VTDQKIPCVDFRTSSYSAGNGACVEVGSGSRRQVVVRDSMDADGLRLAVASAGWREFVGRVKAASIRAC